jgi:tRNA(fMet)-specific endonuclease VapC
MSYLLDTNSCIQFLNGRSEAIRRRLESTQPKEIALCSVVRAELLYGAMKSSRPAENLSRIRSFIEHYSSFPFDDDAARIYGIIRARLERAGKPMGLNDFLIASIALAQGVTLVTHNTREFSRIEELDLEDWEE